MEGHLDGCKAERNEDGDTVRKHNGEGDRKVGI